MVRIRRNGTKIFGAWGFTGKEGGSALFQNRQLQEERRGHTRHYRPIVRVGKKRKNRKTKHTKER